MSVPSGSAPVGTYSSTTSDACRWHQVVLPAALGPSTAMITLTFSSTTLVDPREPIDYRIEHSGDQLERATRFAGPGKLAVTGDQNAVQPFCKGNVRGVVGGEVVAKLPDPLQQRCERHAPDG